MGVSRGRERERERKSVCASEKRHKDLAARHRAWQSRSTGGPGRRRCWSPAVPSAGYAVLMTGPTVHHRALGSQRKTRCVQDLTGDRRERPPEPQAKRQGRGDARPHPARRTLMVPVRASCRLDRQAQSQRRPSRTATTVGPSAHRGARRGRAGGPPRTAPLPAHPAPARLKPGRCHRPRAGRGTPPRRRRNSPRRSPSASRPSAPGNSAGCARSAASRR